MKYLIIGGTGSLGKRLIHRLTAQHHELFVYSRDEGKHWSLAQDLKTTNVTASKLTNFVVGDIRDPGRLLSVMNTRRPDVVIIAAALKQVDTCEASPTESVATNLIGTQNVVDAVNNAHWHPRKVLFVSTDKAAAPVSSYGMCKALSERLITSQVHHSIASNAGTRWMCTRYGNVLESRGSIIPLFKYQAENAETLTITDPSMTRFVMTLDQSVDLIEDTIKNAENGETWIPLLPSMKIGDIAEIFSERSGKPIKIIGLRPGEKKHEDLMTATESMRAYLTGGRIVVKHAMSEQDPSKERTYSSDQNVLSKEQLFVKLNEFGVLDAPLSSFVGKSIEEIRRD